MFLIGIGERFLLLVELCLKCVTNKNTGCLCLWLCLVFEDVLVLVNLVEREI